jgi:hypothetical protein
MVLRKLMDARLLLHSMGLEKTGENKFAGYKYFELGDFLVPAQKIFADVGLCGVVSFTADIATLTITDLDDASTVVITSPMGSAALKGCHEVQNIGAVETYQRRYLWVAAFEIVEHDALDATTGSEKKAPGLSATGKASPTDGVWESLSEESQDFIQKLADWCIDATKDGRTGEAAAYIREQNLDADEMTAMWTRMDSKVRTPLKKALEGK